MGRFSHQMCGDSWDLRENVDDLKKTEYLIPTLWNWFVMKMKTMKFDV